jgi:hypothetical protein
VFGQRVQGGVREIDERGAVEKSTK